MSKCDVRSLVLVSYSKQEQAARYKRPHSSDVEKLFKEPVPQLRTNAVYMPSTREPDKLC